MTQVSKKEILDLVIENIKNNGRCLNNNGDPAYYHFYYDYYKYYGNKKIENMCAIGLFTKNPKKMEYNFHSKNCVDIENQYDVNFDKLLREQYKGHSLDFWEEVQCLHDKDEYWCGNGFPLTSYGQSFLFDIEKLCEHSD